MEVRFVRLVYRQVHSVSIHRLSLVRDCPHSLFRGLSRRDRSEGPGPLVKTASGLEVVYVSLVARLEQLARLSAMVDRLALCSGYSQACWDEYLQDETPPDPRAQSVWVVETVFVVAHLFLLESSKRESEERESEKRASEARPMKN